MKITLQYAIHTGPLTNETATALVQAGQRAEAYAVYNELDCLWVWGERNQPDWGCVDHIVIGVTNYGSARQIATDLFNSGAQVVVTDFADWSVEREGFPKNWEGAPSSHEHRWKYA